MRKSLRSAMLVVGSVVAIEGLAADSGHRSPGFAVHTYCIRLLGDHAKPVGSKQIVVSTDDEAREAAAQFLNEYDKDADAAAVAFPFIVVEGHPCDGGSSLPSDAPSVLPADAPERSSKHQRHHHHRRSESARPAPMPPPIKP